MAKGTFFWSGQRLMERGAYIKGSVADMESLLLDVENNVPREEVFFKRVEDDRIRDRCNFRKVCD